ncbi:MAG: hypothetical protein LAT82_01615 [Nanoarchaeota archaeon]|nr:hypothetical protein [Nanoarchaeota archaeon]
MVKSKIKKKDSSTHVNNHENEVKSKKERRDELKKSGGLVKILKNNIPIIIAAVILLVILVLVLNQGEGESTGLGPAAGYEGPVVVMHQFHDPTCPHCIRQSEFNPNILATYPYLQIVIHNIRTPAGQEALQEAIETTTGLANERIGTPITVVGDNYLIGFGDASSTGIQMANLVEEEYERLLALEEN